MVVAETRDHWRKIRDRDGDECWMFHTLLRDLSHVVATQDVTLTTRPGGRGRDVARLSSGVMARLARRRDGWALIEAGALRGWAPAAALWGLGPDVRASADDLN